ncbi:MAG: hydantoinase B/oxoprolinase family protein [Rhodospirillales bacterium]
MSLDRITLDILSGKLTATVDEMGAVLARTSMSPLIYEILDFACGLCDAQGRLIAQGNGITLFTGTFSEQVGHLIAKHGDSLAPGDVFIANHPYDGGTHANDVAIMRPIFLPDGSLLAFAVAVAHWLDIGGAKPGSLPPDATEIFQEGLRLPCLRLCRDQSIDPTLLDLLSVNLRFPDLAIGDLKAELAATQIAEDRLLQAAARYGGETLRACFAHILQRDEVASRRAVAALPDGVYSARDTIDGDGASDTAIPVELAVTIAGESMTFDFTGCAAARPAPINCTRGALLSAVKTVFKALVEPQATANDGWFAPLRLIAPPGTVFTAEAPSPVGWYYEGSAQASELAWKALAPLAPERFSAGSYMSLTVAYICGRGGEGRRAYVHIEPAHGGWGAAEGADGASALIALTDGDTYNTACEVIEDKFPLRLRSYRLNTEAGGGAGRWRGGFGLIREYEILEEGNFLYCSVGRSRTPPWGLEGGEDGSCNGVEVLRDGEVLRLARTPHVELQPGDRVRIVTGGGGGYGSPLERPRDAVAADLAAGYVTPEIARDLYGWAPTE